MSQEPVSPSAVFSLFQMGNRGSERGRFLVRATHRWQLELDFLPSLRGLSWASPLPAQPQMSAQHPRLLCSLPVRKRTQGALATVSDSKGHSAL